MNGVDFLVDSLPVFWQGFRATLLLAFASYAGALILGAILAVLRISPAAPARAAGLAYVEWFRNVPLLVLMFVAILCLPKLGVRVSPFSSALLVLVMYTAAQVCEALRAGINSIARGQAEAGRALGLTFGQNLRHVVLPQAARTVVPPLGSIFIALVKNTAVASLIGVVEITFQFGELARDAPSQIMPLLIAIAVCYLIITIPAGYAVARFERRAAVAR
ncbi:amino acid ABC transporter permease [Rugosimonospora acidiphila]|uniref:Amino acid ABC transporter permease n=1 Tax=Rugosimonospora acidiphila TaxID=556531 RepID=A0ABP9RJZ7_9ACTN